MFHSRGAEQENEPLYNDVRSFGKNKQPFSDDRKFKVYTSEIGFRSFEIYSGVWLFNALYIKTALLNYSLSANGSQPSSLNLNADGVLNSVCKIIRAARFCNFVKRSMFALEFAPQAIEP